MSSSWGFLGRPPQSVIDGTHPDMEWFRRYQDEVAKVMKQKPTKKRAEELDRIKKNYLIRFPQE